MSGGRPPCPQRVLGGQPAMIDAEAADQSRPHPRRPRSGLRAAAFHTTTAPCGDGVRIGQVVLPEEAEIGTPARFALDSCLISIDRRGAPVSDVVNHPAGSPTTELVRNSSARHRPRAPRCRSTPHLQETRETGTGGRETTTTTSRSTRRSDPGVVLRCADEPAAPADPPTLWHVGRRVGGRCDGRGRRGGRRCGRRRSDIPASCGVTIGNRVGA